MPVWYSAPVRARLSALLILSALLLNACSSLLPAPAPAEQATSTANPGGWPTPEPVEPPEELPRAEVTFTASLPADASGDDRIFINLLDEVTGLALNVEAHAMQMINKTHAQITLPLPLGAVVKYRYSRQPAGEDIFSDEHQADGRQVRYRLYYVGGPGQVNDAIARWTDSRFIGETGRIYGKIQDDSSGAAVPDIMVAAAGMQTLTDATGEYLLEGIPPGTHNLVAYALDGRYRTFQQGARVEAGTGTPAPLRLQPAPMVRVSFNVQVPGDTLPAAPLRLAGNLAQLGNSFGDLAGGFNLTATRLPLLSLQPGGGYRLEMTLPAGADVRYLYTLGDGFWSAERQEDGSPALRRVIIPAADLEISDRVASWANPSAATPLIFDVHTPEDSPNSEPIFIQFNPLIGWTEPIPMWRLGENRWIFALTGPLGLGSNLKYRICRGPACGAADDIQTPGAFAAGLPAVATEGQSAIRHTVEGWAWPAAAASVEQLPDPGLITPRPAGFVTGVELQPAFQPTWSASRAEDLAAMRALGAGWVVLSPTWTFLPGRYPLLDLVPGGDPLWSDLSAYAASAQARGLQVALFPQPRFSTPLDEWWQAGERDFAWWIVWFNHYYAFALHHAELARQTGSAALILGGDWLAPALPNGALPDGMPSNVPPDADERWRRLLKEVRQIYSGPLWWAVSDAQALSSPPPFLDDVDGLYMLVSEPLIDPESGENPTDAAFYQSGAARLLDNLVLPLQLAFSKPVILAAAYPAIDGAATGLNPLDGAALPDWTQFMPPGGSAPPGGSDPALTPDLDEQAMIYAALLEAANAREWVGGFVSRGYYPPAALGDPSASLRGKPAGDILQAWFQGWAGK